MHRTSARARWIAACALATLILAGCTSATDVTYVAESGEYTAQELAQHAASVAPPSFANAPVAEASALRKKALTSLRRDDETIPVADLLTQAFPGDTRAVPYYVERAKVDGRDAWIVVEVWGSPAGSLDKSRVWAFDAATSDVIVSTVF